MRIQREGENIFGSIQLSIDPRLLDAYETY